MNQWLGLGTFTVGAQIRSLVKELEFYKLRSVDKKKKKNNNRFLPQILDLEMQKHSNLFLPWHNEEKWEIT